MDTPVKLMPYNLVSGFNSQIQPQLGCQQTVNMYIVLDSENDNPPALYDLPGIMTVATLGTDTTLTCRGFIVEGDYLFAVYGQTIYRIDKNYTYTQIGGSLSTDSGPVRIAKNQTQIIFVDGVNGYLWNFQTNVAIFPLPRLADGSNSFPGQPIDITTLFGYFIVVEGQSNKWFWSNLGDGSIWVPANFNELQSLTDTCQAIATINFKLFIYGKVVCETWYVDPIDNNEPFQRNTNLLFEFGTPARASVQVNNDGTTSQCVWLASTKNGIDSIKMSDGGTPVSISSPQIEYVLTEYQKTNDLSDAAAMIYKENGHYFYEITFPTSNSTWVCDISSNNPPNAWFKREMENGDCFIGRYYSNFNGINYMGSGIDNRLFALSSDIGTYDGVQFPRKVYGATFNAPTLYKTTILSWKFDMMMGTGSPAGLTQNPIFYISYSRDGGVTYGNRIKGYVGPIGMRRATVLFNNIGTTQMISPYLEFYNNVPTALIGSVMTYQECAR